MNLKAIELLARSIDGDARVVHGRFLVDTYKSQGGKSIIAGVGVGDELAPNDREAVLATVIVIVHKRLGTTHKSPEDFMEDPTP